MFSKYIIAAIAVGAILVCADPNPSIPGPGDVYNEGSNCQIAWSADTSGTWTQMSIELMTGNNWNMIHLADITTIDATKELTYSYPCPQVTPNSAIYFYQFKDPSSKETYWTTRFAIADASGATTPPLESTQPSGDQIPWGTGSIVGSGGNGTTTSPPTSAPSSTPLPSSTVTSPARLAPSLSSSLSTSTSATPNATSSNTSGAVIASSPQAAGAVVALVAVAFTFVF